MISIHITRLKILTLNNSHHSLKQIIILNHLVSNYDHRSALRIRVKQNTFEITLKVPAKVGLIEYNHPIDIKPHIGQTIVKSTLPNDIQKFLLNLILKKTN